MILIITNKQDQTADFLIVELKRRNIDYFRFNTEEFPQNVSISWQFENGKLAGIFEFNKRTIDFKEVTSAWYRRPVTPFLAAIDLEDEEKDFISIESKAFLEGIWKTLDCFWVSKPESIYNAENKMLQISVAAKIGFEVWPTLITNSVSHLNDFYYQQKEIIYKPLRKGKITRKSQSSIIFTNRVLPTHKKYFQNIKLAPGIFQKYIRKLIEIRVTVIGNKVFAVEIHSQENKDSLDDWRKGNIDSLQYKIHSLPPQIEQQCRDIVKALDLQFGAIDLILTPENRYVFLEINPNGQWAWIQQLIPEFPLRENLVDLLINHN